MTTSDWIALVVGGPTALAILFAPVGAILRRLTRIEQRVLAVELQHQNNGGSSTRDAIDRIESLLRSLASN